MRVRRRHAKLLECLAIIGRIGALCKLAGKLLAGGDVANNAEVIGASAGRIGDDRQGCRG